MRWHRQGARPQMPEAAARQRLEPGARHLVLPDRAAAARRRQPPRPAAQGRLRHQGPGAAPNWTWPGNCWPSPPPATTETAIRIADAITAAMRATRTLPDPGRVRKAVGGGQRPCRQAACHRGVAGGMAGRQEEAAARHRAQLRRAHPPVPQAASWAYPDRPAPGHRRRRRLRPHRGTQRRDQPRPAPAAAPPGGRRSTDAGWSARPPASGSAPPSAQPSAPT